MGYQKAALHVHVFFSAPSIIQTIDRSQLSFLSSTIEIPYIYKTTLRKDFTTASDLCDLGYTDLFVSDSVSKRSRFAAVATDRLTECLL